MAGEDPIFAPMRSLPERREPSVSSQLLKAAEAIVVYRLTFDLDDGLHQSHLCYAMMRMIAQAAQIQLRQLAVLVTMVDQLRDSEGYLRPMLVHMWQQAAVDACDAIQSDLEQLDEIAANRWYGSLLGDLDWLSRTMTAARDLLLQILPART